MRGHRKRNRSREDWHEDLASRQRNIVFPDTLRNEAAGWRRLIESGKPLKLVQIIAFGLMFAVAAWVIWDIMKDKMAASAGAGSLVERFWTAFADWILLFGLCGAVFVILRWSVRRALRRGSSDHR